MADKYIIGLYQQFEDEVIADIARRVKATGRYTETAELMAKSMVEQGYSAEKIQAEVMKKLRADKAYQMAVAENTAAYKQEIQDIIDNLVKEAKEAGNELVAQAGNMAWNNDLSMWKEHGVDLDKPNSMSQLIAAFQAQTVGELKNLTKTMGFKNTVLGTTGVLNAYQREMDLALLKVATGTFSYDQAVNDCVHRLAQSGLRSIDYANGRSYQLDTAARMSVRTGLSQLSGKIMEANLKQTGQDLVITSQHMGSRPEHVPWQNKVFSYSGKNKKYPDFFKSTGYGTATGLKGVNCTHEFYPFWEGADFVPDDIEEPKPVKINGKTYDYYQVTQKQRQMERNIRATKREIEAQRAIGGDAAELQSKLRKQTADYKQFSAAAGVKVKENRLRVIHGTSAKTKSPKKSSKVNKNVALNRDGKEISFNFDKMFDSSKKHFNLERETKKSNDIKEKITVLSNQYNTYLTGVKVGGSTIHAAGYVDIDGMMILSNSKPQTFLHEFAHSIASHDRVKLGLASESEIAFEKELAKLFSEYKDVVNGNPKKGIKGDYRKSISAYSLKDKEEFFAEAFAHYKMREFGYDMSKVIEYGNDFTYSTKVVELVDKYFRKSSLENIGKGIRSSDKKKNLILKRNRNRDTINLKENIEKSNSKLEELKKRFSEITEGYSYDEWFKEFKSIEEGYGEASEGDELFEKLKALDKKIKSTEQKKTELLHQKERRKQLDTGYAGKVPDDKLDEFNKNAFEQIKLDTGYSDEEAETFHDALKEYFGGDYDKILTGETQTAKIIRNGIDRMPVYEGTTYRGMTFSDCSGEDITQFTNLKPGDKLPSKGIISSWSSDKMAAESFGSVSTKSAESSSVILVCENNKTGVGVQHISKFGEREAEVLSGSNYEVLEVYTESKYDYVSRRSDLLYFPNDLEELESELKNQVVCIIKVKEV